MSGKTRSKSFYPMHDQPAELSGATYEQQRRLRTDRKSPVSLFSKAACGYLDDKTTNIAAKKSFTQLSPTH